jgi:hypothetical protein
VEHGCLGPLEQAVRYSGASARAIHVREWSKVWAKRTMCLLVCNLFFKKRYASRLLERETLLYRNDRENLAQLEFMFSLFGSLYRLQEVLASCAASESDRLESEVLAGRTLAHAQRLEVCIWMLTSGLRLMRNEMEYPFKVIESTSAARRRALGNDFLLIDHLWHHMNSGSASVPDGTFIWPPASFDVVLDAIAASLVIAPVRHSVLLYTLLDAAALGSASDLVEQCAKRLALHLGFSDVLERRVRAMWQVDRNVDTLKAAHELAEVGFGEFEEALGMLTVKKLRLANNPQASLIVLRFSPAFFVCCFVSVLPFLLP